MTNTSWFPTALEARNNIVKDSLVHEEIRAIESSVIQAATRGDYEVSVENASPMTSVSRSTLLVSSVDPVTNLLIVPNHGLSTGDALQVRSSIELPPPLVSTNFYYAIYIDDNSIKLASSRINAMSRRPISIDFNKGVGSISVVDPGSNYSVAPHVSFSGGDGTVNPTARAFLSSVGSVNSVELMTQGSGFNSVPSVSVVSNGFGAQAGEVWFGVVSALPSLGGSNYSLGDLLTLNTGNGSPAILQVAQVSAGQVVSAVILDPGRYNSLPSLINSTTNSSSSGTGAEFNVSMGISAIDVASGGQEYLAPPIVSISGGGGSNAVARAVLTGAAVSSFTIVNPGAGYTGVPSVLIDNGSGASVVARLVPSQVASITVVNNGGASYSTPPAVSFSTPGSGATVGSVILTANSVQLAHPGLGYVVGDILTASGGIAQQSVTIEVLTVGPNGSIGAFVVDDSGRYTALPSTFANPVIGGSGSGASFNLNMGIKEIVVGLSGSGYTVPPLVIFDNPNGASAHAEIEGGEVTRIVVDTPGSQFVSPPYLTLSNGGGAQAVATLAPTGVGSISVVSGGSSYIGTPAITITGGGGSGAQAVAVVALGTIIQVNITNPGSGYTSPPTVSVAGNAQLTATLSLRHVESISLTDPGSGYNQCPTVSIAGPATALAPLVGTSIAGVDVMEGGSNYASDPQLSWTSGPEQLSAPVKPISKVHRGFGVSEVVVDNPGYGFTIPPNVVLSAPLPGGTPATATASLNVGQGTFSLTPYGASRDYFLVWKNLAPSDALLARPMADQMSAVMAYFTNLGYSITRVTNSGTANTMSWKLSW